MRHVFLKKETNEVAHIWLCKESTANGTCDNANVAGCSNPIACGDPVVVNSVGCISK
jgi:hypothetical protein